LRQLEHPPSDVRGQQRLVITHPEQGGGSGIFTVHRVQDRLFEQRGLPLDASKQRPALSGRMEI
jgi:hypothetical protein